MSLKNFPPRLSRRIRTKLILSLICSLITIVFCSALISGFISELYVVIAPIFIVATAFIVALFLRSYAYSRVVLLVEGQEPNIYESLPKTKMFLTGKHNGRFIARNFYQLERFSVEMKIAPLSNWGEASPHDSHIIYYDPATIKTTVFELSKLCALDSRKASLFADLSTMHEALCEIAGHGRNVCLGIID